MDNDKSKESDGNVPFITKNSDTAVKINGSPDQDSAMEKLVNEDGKIKSNSEVQFISADSQNGDAKIDIDYVRVGFAGMTKEELMKYANDPFWVRIRWILFVAFWLLWVAMLAGAILIIVTAPKCSGPDPLRWWQEKPIYQIEVETFADSDGDGVGDLVGITNKLDYLKSLGINGIELSPIMKRISAEEDKYNFGIVNFTDVDPSIGSLQDFKELLKATKDKEMQVILRFSPNHSSRKHPWFISSSQNDESFKDFYIWSAGRGQSEIGEKLFPNNWVSVDGNIPAWTYEPTRSQFFLNQFNGQPDLNYHNKDVVYAMTKILRFWLDLGVVGFEFDKIRYLVEDEELRNETVNKLQTGEGVAYTHDQYQFYTHDKTADLPATFELLKKWKNLVYNVSDINCVLSASDPMPLSVQEEYLSKGRLSYVANSRPFGRMDFTYNATKLRAEVDLVLASTPNTTLPNWQLWSSSGLQISLRDRLGEQGADAGLFASMLLPGSVLYHAGDELALKSDPQALLFTNTTDFVPDESETHVEAFRALSTARSSSAFQHGDTDLYVLQEGAVFAYTRIKSGKPGYLVVVNLDLTTEGVERTVDLSSLRLMSSELTVFARSTNLVPEVKIKGKLHSNSIRLPPGGAIAFTFVPEESESQ